MRTRTPLSGARPSSSASSPHLEDRLLGGLEVVDVEHGLRQQEAPARVPGKSALGEHLGPRQVVGPALASAPRTRLVDVVEDRRQPFAADVALAHRAHAARHHRGEAAQAAVARELGEVGLHLGQPIREILELLGRQIEEGMALEELAAAGQVDAVKATRASPAMRPRERRRGFAGALGRGGVDDDEDDCRIWAGNASR